MPVTWSDEKRILYIAPVGVKTHDLPHTVASNMVKVFYAFKYLLGHGGGEVRISHVIGWDVIHYHSFLGQNRS